MRYLKFLIIHWKLIYRKNYFPSENFDVHFVFLDSMKKIYSNFYRLKESIPAVQDYPSSYFKRRLRRIEAHLLYHLRFSFLVFKKLKKANSKKSNFRPSGINRILLIKSLKLVNKKNGHYVLMIVSRNWHDQTIKSF